MSDGGRAGTSSASKRRRERRLRAAWRHEQLSVRMALAAAQHSAPKCAGLESHEAPRGQTTASAARTRPEPIEEVSEPQIGAVTVGNVAAPGPLLSTPSLADTAADTVDDRAVQILLQPALKKKEREEEKEEEKEERKRQEEVAEHERRMRVLDCRVRRSPGALGLATSREGRGRRRGGRERLQKLLPHERRPSGTEAIIDLSRGRGRRLWRRCSSRRKWQSRSVTWLPRGLSSQHRCWRTLQPKQWTPARQGSSFVLN